MRILFADALPLEFLARLTTAGHEYEVRPELTAEDLPEAVGGFDALVVRSTKVHAATITAADELELIVRAGAGTNNIDVQAAADAGVAVCNVPGKNAIAVAELTLGLLLSADRHIADGVLALREGRWDKKAFSDARGLYGRQLGIVGLGEIGLAVAGRAKAFGMQVVSVRNPGRSQAMERRIRSIGIRLVDDLDELLASSDVVSLHVPSTDETRAMVDAAFLAKMRDGAVLINTSRGDLLDEDAVLAALDSGRLTVALDVWPDEPTVAKGDFRSPLASHPRVVGTHHIGASTAQAQEAVASGTIDVITAYASGEMEFCVNMAERVHDSCTIAVRHLDRVGVLASVLAVLRSNGLNVGQMRNQIFQGSNAAVATIDIYGQLTDGAIEDIAALDNVIGVSADKSITE
ncbi:MAG: NAD(P)-dependent oxidoreductase [Acidimicrobiales bacterium]